MGIFDRYAHMVDVICGELVIIGKYTDSSQGSVMGINSRPRSGDQIF